MGTGDKPGTNDMAKKDQTIDAQELSHLFLLRGVEIESALGLLEGCPTVEYKAGEVILEAGQRNRFLYSLISGSLRVHIKLTLDPIVVLQAGDFLGELSVIDHQPTSAYVVADEDSRLLAIGETAMWSLIDNFPAVAANMMFVLAQRMRHGNSLILTSQQLQLEYDRYAIIDAPTGLHNRRWLDNMLGQHMKMCSKSQRALCVLLVGIDDFQSYVEEQGQAAADRMLHTVAWTLRDTMRPGDLIARSDTDQFAALLPNADATNGQAVGERIRQAVGKATPRSLDQRELPVVTVSVGITQMNADDTPEDLLASALDIMTEAQANGGDRTSIAGSSS